MRNDSLAVDWLELNNFTDLVKTSPVMRSAEPTETKELSKTPIFLYICVCVCCFGFFSSFRTNNNNNNKKAYLDGICFLQVKTSKWKNIELPVNNLFLVHLFRIE